jgi:hypothetical protein
MITVVSADTQPGGSTPNEDLYLTGADWALVLDGVTRPPGDGCVHDVPWYVESLAGHLASGLSRSLDLRAVLAEAITAASDSHRDTCDLGNGLSPAAQVAIVRHCGGLVEYLVLGDATVVWQLEGADPEAVCDDRADHLSGPPEPVEINGIRRYPLDYVASVRNRPGGFWVASTDPGAADEALTGSLPADRLASAMLLSDGLTRLVERFDWSWQEVLDAAEKLGVSALIDEVRRSEIESPRRSSRGKSHDDATGVLIGVAP